MLKDIDTLIEKSEKEFKTQLQQELISCFNKIESNELFNFSIKDENIKNPKTIHGGITCSWDYFHMNSYRTANPEYQEYNEKWRKEFVEDNVSGVRENIMQRIDLVIFDELRHKGYIDERKLQSKKDFHDLGGNTPLCIVTNDGRHILTSLENKSIDRQIFFYQTRLYEKIGRNHCMYLDQHDAARLQLKDDEIILFEISPDKIINVELDGRYMHSGISQYYDSKYICQNEDDSDMMETTLISNEMKYCFFGDIQVGISVTEKEDNDTT